VAGVVTAGLTKRGINKGRAIVASLRANKPITVTTTATRREQ
jgi:hypothetical protein